MEFSLARGPHLHHESFSTDWFAFGTYSFIQIMFYWHPLDSDLCCQTASWWSVIDIFRECFHCSTVRYCWALHDSSWNLALWMMHFGPCNSFLPRKCIWSTRWLFQRLFGCQQWVLKARMGFLNMMCFFTFLSLLFEIKWPTTLQLNCCCSYLSLWMVTQLTPHQGGSRGVKIWKTNLSYTENH